MTYENKMRAAWSAGRQTFGYWGTMPGGIAAEIMARQDVDYVTVDLQHGMFGVDAGIPMIQAITAAGKSPVVRVPWNQPAPIMQALDAGAEVVVVPMIDGVEDARRAAAAFRYPPLGIRSYGPIRVKELTQSPHPEDLQFGALLAMIETPTAIEQVEAIAQVDGIDGLYVGPADLSLSLGLSPVSGPDEPLFRETIGRILDVCRRHGLVAGAHAANGTVAARYTSMGFDMITVGSDSSTLAAAVRQQVAIARAGDGAEAPQEADASVVY